MIEAISSTPICPIDGVAVGTCSGHGVLSEREDGSNLYRCNKCDLRWLETTSPLRTVVFLNDNIIGRVNYE